jgi:hypothetical protein
MTERHNALLVVLDHEIREDDLGHVAHAIKMIRGILSVVPSPSCDTHAVAAAKEQLRYELIPLIREIVMNKTKIN